MRRRFIKTQTSLSYMTIEAIERTTVRLPAKIEYSVNGNNTWKEGCYAEDLNLNPGATISFRNMRDRLWIHQSFEIKGSCNLRGNCMSLIPDGKMYDHAFEGLFKGCNGIISVDGDFLPATKLKRYCYRDMFQNCTSLVTAPVLPATTLAGECYAGMFYGCSKLNYIKALFTTSPSSLYTSNWVKGVSSNGTFVKSKNAAWNVTGDNGIPSGWTVQTV